MDHLALLREKIRRLRDEIAHLQELNDQYRFAGSRCLHGCVPNAFQSRLIPLTPHFAGPSYRRKGNRTETASEQQFDELLASRLSKSGEILKWINKAITIDWMRTEHMHQLGQSPVRRSKLSPPAIPSTLLLQIKLLSPETRFCFAELRVSFDNPKGRLKLEVYPHLIFGDSSGRALNQLCKPRINILPKETQVAVDLQLLAHLQQLSKFING